MIPLAPGFLCEASPEDLQERLERIVRSSRYEIDRSAGAIRLLGPDVSYYANDPYLPAGLSRLSHGLEPAHAPAFHTRTSAFDLCLEDSWSGYFVADWLRERPGGGDLVFVHLDHHTDMMSSLLERRGEILVDPADGSWFDAEDPCAWQKGITAGSIGIGSFVTTLFELRRRLHVRHVNNYTTSDYVTYGVVRDVQTFPEVPAHAFACIRKRRHQPQDSIGTYRGGRDPARVLADMPPGRVVAHVDLDYLINDFNGNTPEPGWTPLPGLRDEARRKLEAFLSAVRTSGLAIEHWIVATSPGFCSAYHWPWLLECLEDGIERLTRAGAPASGALAPAATMPQGGE